MNAKSLKQYRLNEYGGTYKQGEKLLENKIVQILLWKLNHSSPWSFTKCAKENQISRNCAKKYLTQEVDLSKEDDYKILEVLNSPLGQFIFQLRLAHPEMYLKEMKILIKQSMNIDISISSICRLEQQMNFVMRRFTSYEPSDRTQFRVKLLRYSFCKTLTTKFMLWQFLATDESHFCESDFKRKQGKFLKGSTKTALIAGLNQQWRISLFATISVEGLIHYQMIDTSVGSVNADAFADYMETVAKMAGSSFFSIYDNAKIHQGEKLNAILQEHNHHVLKTAPYSPDLMPIENWFHEVKMELKEMELGVDKYETMRRLATVLERKRSKDCSNYFVHSYKAWLKEVEEFEAEFPNEIIE